MLSFIALCFLLGLGHLLRMKIKLLQRLYLPSCVIAGLVGLIIIQTLAAIPQLASINSLVAGWIAPWSKLPSVLINVVFACLFLGVALPKLSTL